MKKSILSFLILAGAMMSLQVEAQLLKKIQNAAAQGVQNATTPKASIAGNNAMEGMLGGMMEPASTEAEYSFSGYMIMEIVTTNSKGKTDEPSRLRYLLTQEPAFMGMSFSDPKDPEMTTTTIMDTKNSAMVMLMENKGEKSSMALKLDYDKVQSQVDKEAEKQLEKPGYKIEKTGNTKTILGYLCEEYHVVSEDGEGNYWVTEKPIDGFSVFSPQSNPMISNKTMERYTSLLSDAPKGSFMEMIFTSNDGSVTDMKVVELEINKPQKYLMTDYPNAMAAADK